MSTTANPAASIHAHIRSHLSFLLANSPIYAHLFSACTLTHASTGRVVVRLPLLPIHLNSKKSLHGSVSATLVDFMGGVAIASYDNRDNTGVSTDIHVSYLSGAKEGDVLEVEGRVERCGGTLAYTSVTVRKEGVDGEKGVVALGRHTKFVKTRS